MTLREFLEANDINPNTLLDAELGRQGTMSDGTSVNIETGHGIVEVTASLDLPRKRATRPPRDPGKPGL